MSSKAETQHHLNRHSQHQPQKPTDSLPPKIPSTQSAELLTPTNAEKQPRRESLSRMNRRSRRQLQHSADSISTSKPSPQGAELSTDTKPVKPLEQPNRILRRGDKGIVLDSCPAVDLKLPPHTPPRPKSMYDGSSVKQHTSNNSAPDITLNRKKNSKTQGRKQSGSASPMPPSNSTPISAPRKQSLTPTRIKETPVKAYAGPTFHASPAASSLPMPKFYSKSVPNVDKTSSFKSMMEHDAPETASESEGSPFQENTQPAHDHRAREASPLDIFFRADEKAKAKARSSQEATMNSSNSHAGLSVSPSRPRSTNRHHSRHPTDSSIGVMFPLEMDGVATEEPPHLKAPTSTNDMRAERPAMQKSSSEPKTDLTEEQRRSKTLALKQLLYSTRNPFPQNNAAGQRPPSSNLRQELTISTSPGLPAPPELPATPTPSRVHNPHMPSRTQSHQYGYVPPYSPFTPSKVQMQGPYSPTDRDDDYTRSVEDGLRRILKLEVLGGDGVSGVKS